MASVAYRAAWGALGYLFLKNSIRKKAVTITFTLPSVCLYFLQNSKALKYDTYNMTRNYLKSQECFSVT